MSTFSLVSFDRRASLIMIPVTIKIGTGIAEYKFAVDTGATFSLMDIDLLSDIGYKQKNCIRTLHTVTASGTETAYEFEIDNIMAFGLIRRNFKIISHSLPPGLGIDGLLGLNFFKNKVLNIDFKLSEISLK